MTAVRVITTTHHRWFMLPIGAHRHRPVPLPDGSITVRHRTAGMGMIIGGVVGIAIRTTQPTGTTGNPPDAGKGYSPV